MSESFQHAFPVHILSQQARLSQEHLNTLFGVDYALTPLSPGAKDDEIICAETITFRTKYGSIPNLRVIGPAVEKTSIRVARSQLTKLFPSTADGDSATPKAPKSVGGALESKAGTVVLADGVTSLKRHLLINPATAGELSLADKDYVSVDIKGPVSRTMSRVIVCVRPDAISALFVDPEETVSLVIDTETRARLSQR